MSHHLHGGHHQDHEHHDCDLHDRDHKDNLDPDHHSPDHSLDTTSPRRHKLTHSVCENPGQVSSSHLPTTVTSASRKSSYDSQGNPELKDEDSSEDDSDVDVTGLGDDAKLPFQVRLLTEASKQNFSSHKFMSSNLEAATFANFTKNMKAAQQSFIRPQPYQAEQKPFFGLSDYMYMDKAQAIHGQAKEIQKVHSGFSIDEIMKR